MAHRTKFSLAIFPLIGGVLLGAGGCGGATRPKPPETVTLTIDVIAPPETPASAGVVVDLEGPRPQPISLTNASGVHFHGSAAVTAGIPIPYRVRLVAPEGAELDSLWEPVPPRQVTPPSGGTALTVTVARWGLAPEPSRSDVTFLVGVPASTPAGDPIWIAGNDERIGSWGAGAGLKLMQRPDGRFMTRVRFLRGTALEFKFTRGSWETVEKDATGGEISNRRHAVADPDTVEAQVLSWRDQTSGGGTAQLTGTIRYHRGVTSQFLTLPRDVIVYLPPHYATETERRYPVLYMHDGQNLMDATTSFAGEWHADETAERLITSGEVEPLILVGVYNTSARIAEYTPIPDAQHGGGNGDNYGRFLVEELKPLIDATYRTKLDAANTGVAGSSLGGLISMHFAETLSSTFGKAGVISPSAWWAGGAILTEVAARPKSPVLIWEDIGTAEGGAETLSAARGLRDALVAKGWVLGSDFRYLEVVGGQHNEAAWAARFDAVLTFLFPAHP